MPRLIAQAVIAAVLIATPAHAAREFVWSSGTCAPASTAGQAEVDNWETDTDMPFHSFGTNRPEKSTTTFGDANNECSHQFDAASGVTSYAGRDVTSTTTPRMAAYLKVSTAPTTRRKIMSFVNGCMVTLEDDAAIPGNVKIKAFFDETDVDDGLCQGSLEDNDTKCDIGCFTNADCEYRGYDSECADSFCNADDECPSEATGSSGCEEGSFGQYSFDPTDWQIITLAQDNGTGTVTCQLWAGKPGYSRSWGAGTHRVGECSGANKEACADDTDCEGVETCDTSALTAITEVRWGTDDTVADAADYLLDSFVYDSDDVTGMVNYRVPELVPDDNTGTQDWVSTGCGGGDDECVDETGNGTSPDEGVTYLSESTSGDGEDLGFEGISLTGTCSTTCSNSNIACDVAGDCTEDGVTSVSFVALARDQGDAVAPETKTLQLCALDNSGDTESCGSAADIAAHGSTDYMPNAFAIDELNPDGGAWSEADVDALRVRMKYTDSGGSPGSLRVTTVHMQPEIAMSDPPIPTNIPDNSGDAQDTVMFIGDSRWTRTSFRGAVVANLTEPNNIINCARGGATTTDGANSIVDALAGKTTQYMPCTADIGSDTKDADVVAVLFGFNDRWFGPPNSPEMLFGCTTNADCVDGGECVDVPLSAQKRCTKGQNGYCVSWCNSNDDCTVGNCTDGLCDENGNACDCPSNGMVTYENGTTRCIVAGTNHLASCTPGGGETDCGCASDADCGPYNCVGGLCGVTTWQCPVNLAIPRACNTGCVNVDGCTDGLCYAKNSLAVMQQSITDIADAADAASADVVWALAPMAETHDPAKCLRHVNESMRAMNAWQRQWAIARGDSFVDLDYCIRARSEHGDIDPVCYEGIDGIHFTSTCMQWMADCISNVFTADAASDGVCDTGACTAGRIGDACTDADDCHTYERTF